MKLEEVRALKAKLLEEFSKVEAQEQAILADFNFDNWPDEVREYTSNLEGYDNFEWVDDTHFIKYEFVSGNNKDEWPDDFVGPGGNFLFGQQFADEWRYAPGEFKLKLLVDAQTGDFDVLEINDRILLPRRLDLYSLKVEIEHALHEFQTETELELGNPNLYPGSSARVAIETVEKWLARISKGE